MKSNIGIWDLVGKEIRFRKIGFLIGVLCVAVAIGSFAGAYTLLRAHEIRTEQILVQQEKQTRVEGEEMEDYYRRIMRDLGHNVMILHKDQSLAKLRATGYPDTYMPEEYAHQLGEGYIETLNHLLPVLQERRTWPEHDIEIILTGTPGQVPIAHLTRFLTEDRQAYKNPIIAPIPRGVLRLGHAVARELNLRPGDSTVLFGEEFTVQEVKAPQGDQEDIMVWCNLETVQRWLDKEGLINAIFALECICDIDAIGQVTEEVNSILPDVQVLEFTSRVRARGLARQRAEEDARRAIESIIAHRAEMGEARRAFAAVLTPLIMLASGLWIFFLTLGNVREREAEIGILRAIGVRESKIMAVFLSKAVIIGLLGAVIGYLGGVIAGAVWGGIPVTSGDFVRMLNPLLFVVALLIAMALCAIAGWIPALKAANSDPADVLRQE